MLWHVVVAIRRPLAVVGLVREMVARHARLRGPNGVLMVVVLAGELRSAAVQNVQAVREVRRHRRDRVPLRHPVWKRLAVPALARHPLPVEPPLAMLRPAGLEEVLGIFSLHVVRSGVRLVPSLEHAVHDDHVLLANADLGPRSFATCCCLDDLDVGTEADDHRTVVVALAACARLRVEPVGFHLGAVVRPEGGSRAGLERLAHLEPATKHLCTVTVGHGCSNRTTDVL